MTSEGGGAVAFPVMTLALEIPPSVARDFSLMIQSCGKFLMLLIKYVKLLYYRFIFYRNDCSSFYDILDADSIGMAFDYILQSWRHVWHDFWT